MFKAKLINDSSYYALRSKHLVIGLLPGVVLAFLVQPLNLSWWILVLLGGFYIALMYMMMKNQKKMHEMAGSWTIELDNKEITLRTGDQEIFQTIEVADLDQIIVSPDVGFHQETAKDLVQEAFRQPIINYIKIIKDETVKQYDFELESHYMMVQFEKVVAQWEKMGIIKE